MKPDATILAFDFGTRRIGVASANTLTRAAKPLATIAVPRSSRAIDAVASLIDEWRPARLVVGLPLHADGTPHAMTGHARRFAAELEARFERPVTLVDERFTTQIAAVAMRDAGVGGRKGRESRDAFAAQIILQAWLDAADDPR
jgi:putative Holliday junction resolvase